MGVAAFGQNRLYDEQGAVDLGNAAKRTDNIPMRLEVKGEKLYIKR